MKRKQGIRTREVKRYKAQMNVDGSRMIKGKHYDQTYLLVASWTAFFLLLTMMAIGNWETQQLD